VGRVESERSRGELLRKMLAYHRKAEAEFAKKRAVIERIVAAPRTSE
jgi:hypothetical protein